MRLEWKQNETIKMWGQFYVRGQSSDLFARLFSWTLNRFFHFNFKFERKTIFSKEIQNGVVYELINSRASKVSFLSFKQQISSTFSS